MEFAWLPLFVALGGLRGARALQEIDVFPSRDGDIRDFTVAARWVYVVTGDHLYQLNLSLGLLHGLPQRGTYKKGVNPLVSGRFNRASEGGASIFTVNTLAPVVERNLLFTCGAIDCGYCEMLNLTDITRILSGEDYEVSRVVPEGASVGFVVDNTYLLSAAEGPNETNVPVCQDIPKISRIRLFNIHNSQEGGLLSSIDGRGDPAIHARHYGVQFVDGFQIKSTIFLLSNVKGQANTPTVRLLWVTLATSESKTETLKSFQGATLVCCEVGEANQSRSRLVSSSVIPGDQPVLLAGIFNDHDVTNTELAIYDISPQTDAKTYEDPDFSYLGNPLMVNLP